MKVSSALLLLWTSSSATLALALTLGCGCEAFSGLSYRLPATPSTTRGASVTGQRQRLTKSSVLVMQAGAAPAESRSESLSSKMHLFFFLRFGAAGVAAR